MTHASKTYTVTAMSRTFYSEDFLHDYAERNFQKAVLLLELTRIYGDALASDPTFHFTPPDDTNGIARITAEVTVCP